MALLSIRTFGFPEIRRDDQLSPLALRKGLALLIYLAEANGKPVEAHTGRLLPEVLPDFPPDILAAYRRTAGPGGVFWRRN